MESFIILINTLLFIINPFKNYIYLNIKYNLKKLIYIYIYKIKYLFICINQFKFLIFYKLTFFDINNYYY